MATRAIILDTNQDHQDRQDHHHMAAAASSPFSISNSITSIHSLIHYIFLISAPIATQDQQDHHKDFQ